MGPFSLNSENQITLMGPSATFELGLRFGKVFEAGGMICLDGPMGSGKTTFAQGFAIGLGVPEETVITSPTFTVVAEHHSGRIPLFHFDFYRIERISELENIGFYEYLERGGASVIEWASMFIESLPESRIHVTFLNVESQESRIADIRGSDARTREIVHSVVQSIGTRCI